MKKSLSIGLGLAAIVSGLSLGAYAALNNQLRGSDTLETMTDYVVDHCDNVSPLVYIGGGSSNGEDAMRKGEQQIAPMSRKLSDSRTCRGPNPQESQGQIVALDGIAVVNAAADCVGDGVAYAPTSCFQVTNRNATAGIDCGADCPPVDNNGTPSDPSDDFTEYCMANANDALRLIFSGLQKTGGSSLSNMKCDGDVRRSLVAQWSEIFANGCAGSTCTSLKHAFRRDDLSGTTDTFLSLLGLPSILSSSGQLQAPFCNGTATEDIDPIRVACDAADSVCELNGTAGLVLPIFVPEVAPVDAGTEYPSAACSSGKFGLAAALKVDLGDGAFDYVCPEGTQYSVASFCLAPFDNSTVGTKKYDCLNIASNKSAFTSGSTKDGRIFNKWLRKANGTIVTDKAGRAELNAFYRLRQSSCSETSSTRNIGCLVANHSCTIGFAGREAAYDIVGSKPLAVRGIFPDEPKILLLKDPAQAANAYPLARFLYLNTHVGFTNVTNAQENALTTCYSDEDQVEAAALDAKFIPLGEAPICVDYNETLCNGQVFSCDSNSDCNFVGKGVCVGGDPSTPATKEGTCDQTCSSDGDCLQPGRTCIAGRCDFASNNPTCN